jgi:hypothetical protein
MQLFVLCSFAFLSGCFFTPKSPDAVEQKKSGGYNAGAASKKTSAVIVGAYNNLAFETVKNFKEKITWIDEQGAEYEMDFNDSSSPLYIMGRNGVVFIAVRVPPGKYMLKNFSIRASDGGYSAQTEFNNRYLANFEIGQDQAVFIGILATVFDKFASEPFNPQGAATIKISTKLENGKTDLYRITNFYNMVTKMPVQTNIMFWEDKNPMQTAIIKSQQQQN